MTDWLRCALPAQADPDLAGRARHPKLVGGAVQALAHARERSSYATPRLAQWFRRARWLGSKERPVVAEAVHGVIRHEALLRASGAADDEGLVLAWTRLVDGDRFEDLPSHGPAPDFATALSLPTDVASEWLERAPDPASLAASLAGRAPVTVRCFRDREDVARRLAAEGVPTRPTERAPRGLHLLKRVNLPELRSFRDGDMDVQDEASQLLIEAVPLEKGQTLLDLCAGAGGKALGLSSRGAEVRAHDVRDKALAELLRRAERLGQDVTIGPPEPADVVLVDAPCSGTGRLRREPALRWNLDPDRHLAVQRQLLDEAARLARHTVVYATCSLLAKENELDLPGWTLTEARTLWPHELGSDGFGWRIWTHS